MTTEEESTYAQDELVTPEARQHADYRPAKIIHAESYTTAMVLINHAAGPFVDMMNRGTITQEQFHASVEIAQVAEAISRPVGIRSASLEARVDNSGSARNLLIEHLDRVRLEATYTRWRQRLPMPKAMVIEMIVFARPVAATARKFKTGYRKARHRLINALDDWLEVREKVIREVDLDDVLGMHRRLGDGDVL